MNGTYDTQVTVRTATDAVIATFCIKRLHVLLHSDHDFESSYLRVAISF